MRWQRIRQRQSSLQNDSYGVDEYEWTSEGDSRSSSRAKHPGAMTFAEAGEHQIRFRVKHVVEEKVSEQTFELILRFSSL